MLPAALLLALSIAPASDAAATRNLLIERCAIPADRIAIQPADGDGAPAILFRGGMTDAQLRCVGTVFAQPGVPSFMFEDDTMRRRYSWLAGRSNLAAMGLLGRLPVYDRTRDTLPGFARKLERFCSAAPGSLLEVGGGNIHVRQAAFDAPSDRSEPLLCAVAALDASGFEPFDSAPPIPLPEVTIPVS